METGKSGSARVGALAEYAASDIYHRHPVHIEPLYDGPILNSLMLMGMFPYLEHCRDDETLRTLLLEEEGELDSCMDTEARLAFDSLLNFADRASRNFQ